MLAYSRWQFGCKGRIVQFEYCRIDTAGKTDHHGRLPAEKGIPANFILFYQYFTAALCITWLLPHTAHWKMLPMVLTGLI